VQTCVSVNVVSVFNEFNLCMRHVAEMRGFARSVNTVTAFNELFYNGHTHSVNAP